MYASLIIAGLSRACAWPGEARVRQTSPADAVGRDDLVLELCWGHGDVHLAQCLQMSPLLWHLFRAQVN